MKFTFVRQAYRALAIVAVAATASAAQTEDVFITPEIPFFEFDNGTRFIMIERNQDNDAVIDQSFAKTSRPCPPFCIHPMSAAPGVETIGELELLDFLENQVSSGGGFLVDARLPNWYDAGTIPGAVNLPFTLFEPAEDNVFRNGILQLLGGLPRGGGQWDFTNAKSLALFCNGPWCDQSPRAIRNLVDLGYPTSKLKYYRGGMQTWLLLGLTVEIPSEVGG